MIVEGIKATRQLRKKLSVWSLAVKKFPDWCVSSSRCSKTKRASISSGESSLALLASAGEVAFERDAKYRLRPEKDPCHKKHATRNSRIKQSHRVPDIFLTRDIKNEK